MRTKINARAIALAGRSRKTEGASQKPKSFISGLLFGLSSASLFLAGELPRPRAPKDGIDSDWKAVGLDLSGALRQHDR